MPKINFIETQLIEAFVYQMVVDKGLQEEDKKQHGKIQHELQMQLDEAVQTAIIDALPEPRLRELSQALDAGITDEGLEQFFQNAGVNYTKVVADAMSKFRKEFMEGKIELSSIRSDATIPSIDLVDMQGTMDVRNASNARPNATTDDTLINIHNTNQQTNNTAGETDR